MQIHEILEAAGYGEIQKVRRISGGDINQAYSFSSNGQEFFIKLNDAIQFPKLFEKEANGLKHLSENSKFRIPKTFRIQEFGAVQFLIMEFMPTGHSQEKDWKLFAEKLANMHRATQATFGFFEDNYLGTQPQNNSESNTWQEFYSSKRILPSMKQMFDNNLADKNDIKNCDRLCNKLTELYPQEPPALLHGDLWSGNYHEMLNGDITVIDPAVYYGHREMDLAMAALFGGFPAIFYEAYNEHYPLQKGFGNRVEVSQLYPLIFHAVRFRGSYIGNVRNILNKFA